MNRRLILAVIVLSLLALACSFNIPLPQIPTPGPENTVPITVPLPASGQARLTLSFGAGELSLSPGAKGLLEGMATYNVPDLKPQVLTQGDSVQVRQGELRTITNPSGIKNRWDFKLGAAPMDLVVNAGAYTGSYDLGGLSLTSLTVKDGASTVNLSFSRPNLAEMTVFRYETGASTVRLKNLRNANFGAMIFNSGGGDYTLDFSGTLKRAATITITSGVSNLILVVPDGVPANVTVESGVSNVNAGSEWTQHGNLYSQAGSGPALTFVIKTGAGNLTLTH